MGGHTPGSSLRSSAEFLRDPAREAGREPASEAGVDGRGDECTDERGDERSELSLEASPCCEAPSERATGPGVGDARPETEGEAWSEWARKDWPMASSRSLDALELRRCSVPGGLSAALASFEARLPFSPRLPLGEGRLKLPLLAGEPSLEVSPPGEGRRKLRFLAGE